MQNLAFALIGIGILSLAGWALWSFFADSGVHPLIRIAVGAIGAGTLILVGVAIRDRITRKKEKFEEVDK